MSAASQGLFDLSVPRRIHVVGVGGPGMSAIAIVLAEMGHTVSGSDVRDRDVLERVRAAGVTVEVGHRRDHVQGCDAVTYSTAVPQANIELVESRSLGIATMHRSGMLAAICAQARSVAVAGTHGKTTTTSMLMLILAAAGLRPGFVIGGDVNDMGTGAQWTGSEWFVVEADESDGTHLELPLHGTVLTNVEVDHLDHYGTFDRIVAGFEQYLRQAPGPKVLCLDDPECKRLAGRLRHQLAGIVTYGRDPLADYTIGAIHARPGLTRFGVSARGSALGEIELPLRGVHNVLNATGALALAMEIGVPFEVAAEALGRFGGVARRFDVQGMLGGATLVDDYAHLPSEIAAVLAAARSSGDGWSRVIAVFQPNRFNRMSVISPEYRDAFVDADVVVITDIYASGTAPLPGVTGKLVVDAVTEAHPTARVVWMPNRDDLVRFVAGELREGDVCVSMGCGDIAEFPAELLAHAESLEDVA